MKTFNEEEIMKMMENRINKLEEWMENPIDVPDVDGKIEKERNLLYNTLIYMDSIIDEVGMDSYSLSKSN